MSTRDRVSWVHNSHCPLCLQDNRSYCDFTALDGWNLPVPHFLNCLEAWQESESRFEIWIADFEPYDYLVNVRTSADHSADPVSEHAPEHVPDLVSTN